MSCEHTIDAQKNWNGGGMQVSFGFWPCPWCRIAQLEMQLAAEREACARLADQVDDMSGREVAAAIRARGQE